MRRWILPVLLLLTLGSVAVLAQAPPPVPALPDTERRTTYTISGSNCNCPLGFQIYGDSTDYGNWIQVYLNGILADPSTYTITSPSGPIATIARPITDAQLNFNALTTGSIQIVGARRPRRIHTFTENRGVAARDLNQLANDLEAQGRETWDLRARSLLSRPGQPFGPMPDALTCANGFLGFDATGLNPQCLQITQGSVLNIPPGTIDNTLLAPMLQHTIKCNATGATSQPADCNAGTVTPMLSQFTTTLPGLVPAPGATTATSQVFLRGDGQWTGELSPSPPVITILTSGMSGLFTPSSGVLFMGITLCGGGGGGGADGTGAGGEATSGSTTHFGLVSISTVTLYLEARGGSGGELSINAPKGPATGGVASGGTINLNGADSEGTPVNSIASTNRGARGAASAFGDGGAGGRNGAFPGHDASVFCAGGGSAGGTAATVAGSSGAAGAYVEHLITQPISANYDFLVGGPGAGGIAGTAGSAGGIGGPGVLIIQQFFQ